MKKLLLENDLIIFEISDGIMIGTFKTELVDLSIAKKITDYRLDLQKEVSYPLISNITHVKNSTKEARDFLASEEGCKGVVAAAILIDSVVGSMIGNFFVRISKPLVPTRLFTNEDEAKKWHSRYVS